MSADTMTTKQVAAAVGVTDSQVRAACRAGKLAGAERVATPQGGYWLVPAHYATPESWRAAVGRPGRRAKKE